MARISRLSGSVAAMVAMLSACGGGAEFTAGESQGGSAAAGGTSSGGIGSGGVAASEGGATPSNGGKSNGGATASSGGKTNGGSAGAGPSQGGSPIGRGGASAGGGAFGLGGLSGLGGILGGGGSAAGDCASLWQNYSQELQAARACSPASMTKQCASEAVLYDACGCDVPVNPASEHYPKASELYSRWKRNCPAPACIIACQENPGEPSCKSPSSGQSVCSF